MRKVWIFLTICLFFLITSCEPVVPTLAVSGLEGVTRPEPESLLEGATSFSTKVHRAVTGQDFILGFDSDNTPRIIGIFDDKQNTWLWKTVGLRDLADQVSLEIGSGIEGELFGMPTDFFFIWIIRITIDWQLKPLTPSVELVKNIVECFVERYFAFITTFCYCNVRTNMLIKLFFGYTYGDRAHG